VWVPQLIRLDLPGTGSGFTLRWLGRYSKVEQVAFLGDDEQVWLFRETSQLARFLASDALPAAPWRALAQAQDQDLAPEKAERYNLWQMIDGTLRWGPGYEALSCSELCIELAFYCDFPELLDELGPDLHTTEPSRWRRVIPLIRSRIRFWGEDDTRAIDIDAIPGHICESHIRLGPVNTAL
jgi:hypothetical protein